MKINNDEKAFANYGMFRDWLEEVNSVTEWKRVTSKHTTLSPYGDNPFPQFGGDEFGVSVSFDEGYTNIPFRKTALTSVMARADVTGKGLQRLFEADKEKFCEHINFYYTLKPKNKTEMLALIQDDKLSALHSGNYSIIPMSAVFDTVIDGLNDKCDSYKIKSCYWSWELSKIDVEITDRYFNSVYQQFLSKYLGNNEIKVHLKVISSDVADSAVRIVPYVIINDSSTLPLAGITATRHYGNANISAVMKGFDKAYPAYEASCRQLGALADVKIVHKRNAMIKAFTYLRIPQRYASALCEKYDNITPSNALDVYLSMSEVFNIMQGKLKELDIMKYQETLTKLISQSKAQWENYDVAGEVTWKAKE